ncbi:MAG: c-type cytochrome biogenesis protein CcmI [Pseudomonadota bacterium]
MFVFWTIVGTITTAAILIVALTGVRAAPDSVDESRDVDIYKAQLKEVARDLERGTITEADADALRSEIARRLLAADAQASDAPGLRTGGHALLIGAGLATGALAIGVYLGLGVPGYGDMPLAARMAAMDARAAERPSQSAAQAQYRAAVPRPEIDEDYQTIMERLRGAVAANPEDQRGLALLARNEARIGNFEAAIAAQRRLMAVQGEAVTGADIRDLAELMIVATGGFVSPQAEAVLRRAAAAAPEDAPTRYYLGLMYNQTGRADEAFALWQPLLEESAPSDPWYDAIREQIPQTAAAAGIRYVLPEGRGPSQADLAAAAELEEAERAEMIAGMVAGLAERLATQGGPPEDWAQLIRSQAVLGNAARAQAILDEARAVFADRADAMRLFATTAVETGLE